MMLLGEILVRNIDRINQNMLRPEPEPYHEFDKIMAYNSSKGCNSKNVSKWVFNLKNDNIHIGRQCKCF